MLPIIKSEGPSGRHQCKPLYLSPLYSRSISIPIHPTHHKLAKRLMLQSLTHCQYPVAVLRYSSVNCATQPAIYLTSFSTSGRAQLIAAGTITGKNEDGVTYPAVPRQSSTHDLHRAPSVTLPSTKLVEQK